MDNIHKHLKNINNRISIHNHKEKQMRPFNHTAHLLIKKHHIDYEGGNFLKNLIANKIAPHI